MIMKNLRQSDGALAAALGGGDPRSSSATDVHHRGPN